MSSNIWSIPLVSSRKQQLLILLKTHLEEGKTTRLIFTPNPEQLVLADQNSGFEQTLRQGDWLLPDGIGLVWATKLLALRHKAQPVTERIAGSDIVTALCQVVAEKKMTALVVGGRGYQNLSQKFPGVEWTEGYQVARQPQADEEAALVTLLTQLRPAVVFVAFGAPEQEEWLVAHRSLLEKNGVKLGMAVGGSFDYVLGKVNRAPSWMQAVGLEWAYRLFQQPWRWRRQLKLITFLKLTLAKFFA